MRLNKYIAYCGVSSRRGADGLIFAGRVKVNGVDTANPATDVDIGKDIVEIDGKTIVPEQKRIYIMLNKPAGVLCTCKDDRGRKTVVDIVGGIGARLFPVGRLDYDTQGLLLLTNDGDFANSCMHPSNEVNKTYEAKICGDFDEKALLALRAGIAIEGRKTARADVKVLLRDAKGAVVRVTLHEGRNRQVKKMFEAVGCKVVELKRVAIEQLNTDGLKPGQWRYMNKDDFIKLKVTPNK